MKKSFGGDKMYIKSKYTSYRFSNKDQSLLIYNSIVGTSSLICIEKGNQVYQELESGVINEKGQWFNILKDKGIIVEKETDESDIIKDKMCDEIYEKVLRLTIMPTEDCNFRCKYCYEEHKKGRMSKELQQAIVKYVRKNIFNFSRVEVSWFGGEPLEEIEIIENLSSQIINICKKAKREYRAGITTNGYDLDYHNFCRLLRCKIYDYQITIDGIKKVHDELRVLKNGEGTYERIMLNLEQIKSKCNKRYFTIAIRTNLTNSSIKYLDKFIHEYNIRFKGDTRFKLFPHFVEKWNEDRFDSSIEGELIENNKRNDIYEILNESDIENLDIYLNFLDSSGLCPAGRKYSYVIGVDGIIYKCTEDFEFADNKIGIMLSNGEMKIDNIKHRKWYMHKVNSSCLKCNNLGKCQSRECPKANIITNSVNCPYDKGKDIIFDMIDRRHFLILKEKNNG